MKYTSKSFTVPAGGQQRIPCASHAEPWLDPRGRCVLCGETPLIAFYMDPPRVNETFKGCTLGYSGEAGPGGSEGYEP